MASKISYTDILAFIFKYSALIPPAVALEQALVAKPRVAANVRKAGLAMIAAAAPDINTTDPAIKAALDQLAAAISNA